MVARDVVDRVVLRMLGDLSQIMTLTGHPTATTVYIGGGTPSVLGPDGLSSFISDLLDRIDCDGAEITVEINPYDLSSPLLERLAAVSVNRLSVGIQSFAPRLRSLIGRRGGVLDQAGRRALKEWRGKLSVDLIDCIPGQTTGDARGDLENALELEVDHLSVYALSVRSASPLSQRVASLTRGSEADGICREHIEMTTDFLRSRGFARYEVSNYARPGCQSLHNLGYWRQKPYLGLGPGAVSTVAGSGGCPVRMSTTTDFAVYIENGYRAATVERLSAADMALERLMLGLRTARGIHLLSLEREMGVERAFLDDPRVTRWLDTRDLLLDGDRLRASERGFLILDTLIADLAAAADLEEAGFRRPWLEWTDPPGGPAFG